VRLPPRGQVKKDVNVFARDLLISVYFLITLPPHTYVGMKTQERWTVRKGPATWPTYISFLCVFDVRRPNKEKEKISAPIRQPLLVNTFDQWPLFTNKTQCIKINCDVFDGLWCRYVHR
jgi:hypothetical protein